MPRASRQSRARSPSAEATADQLHSGAIHLLRRLRGEDVGTGLSGPQASALSVIVFRGPVSLGALATAEQVRPPTITRMIRELERQGLVRRSPDPADRRVQQVAATALGRRLLQEGRRRRVERLAREIGALTAAQQEVLREAGRLLLELGRRKD